VVAPVTNYYDAAFELGRSYGFDEGYAAGFEAGQDVTAGRVLLDHLVDADLTAVSGQYAELQALRAAGPCDDPKCGACGVRRDALARQGGDFLGRAVLRVVAS
jgi:hypothetical protein